MRRPLLFNNTMKRLNGALEEEEIVWRGGLEMNDLLWVEVILLFTRSGRTLQRPLVRRKKTLA